MSRVGQDDFHGYTVAYDRDEIQFPVYAVLAIGGALLARGVMIDNIFLVAIGIAAIGYVYHNYPLLETGRPRLGAGQYGVFVEGLGIIAWRSINDIDIVAGDHRGVVHRELRLSLSRPIGSALIVDWRKRPVHRFLMRLPWASRGPTTIDIPLDVFDQPADDIHATFVRMRRFYGA